MSHSQTAVASVAQLQNLIGDTVAFSRPPGDSAYGAPPCPGIAPDKLPSFDEARREFTRSYLSHILSIAGGNVSHAARLAQRNRTDFYTILQRYLLAPGDFKGVAPDRLQSPVSDSPAARGSR